MSSSAYRASAYEEEYDQAFDESLDHGEDGAFDPPFGELDAGERIGQPATRTGLKTLLAYAAIVIAVASCTWALLGDQLTWRELGLLVPTVSPVPTPPKSAATESPLPETASTLVPQPLPSSDPAPVVAAPVPPAATSYDEAKAEPEPLKPPAANPSDRFQVRASAIGLHPELSHSLLSRLTDGDYKNAAHAIKTALAETPEDGTYVWPSNPKRSEAVYAVHFVRGVTGCRRYVVTIAVDGWATTAPPVENCSTPAKTARTRG